MTTLDEAVRIMCRSIDNCECSYPHCLCSDAFKEKFERAVDKLMPLLNRAERTAGSIEICPQCKRHIEMLNGHCGMIAGPIPCPIRTASARDKVGG